MRRIKQHTLKIIKHPLFSGSMIMFVGNMGANVINYVYHLVMGRMLGPIGYGVLASLYSIIYLVGIIPTSASVAVVKFVSSAKEIELYSIYDSIKKLVFKLAVVLSLLMLVSAPTVAKFLHIEDVSSVAIIAPILFLSLITLTNQSTSQGLLKFMGTVVPTLISSLSKLLIGVTLIYFGWSIFGAMFAIVVGAVFAYLYSHKFIKKHIKKTKIRAIDLRPFLKYSGPVLLQSLAFTSIFTVDVLLVKHFLDPFSAGLYAAISTLGKIIFFATSPITATMFPVVSKRRASNQGYIKIFLVSLLATASVATLITVFYWLFPELAIGALYGKEYLSASVDLVWMGVFMLFYTLSFLLVNFNLSVGKVKIVMFPLVAAITQIWIIWFRHENIGQVIQVSFLVCLIMFVCLAIYTGYNLIYDAKKRI